MKNKGFTLIELIVSIVILSTLGVFSAKFVSDGVTLYVEANVVKKMASDMSFVTRKIDRLYKNAVPNSLEISPDGTSATFAYADGVDAVLKAVPSGEGIIASMSSRYAFSPQDSDDASSFWPEYQPARTMVAECSYGSSPVYYDASYTEASLPYPKSVARYELSNPRMRNGNSFVDQSSIHLLRGTGRLFLLDKNYPFVTIKLDSDGVLYVIRHKGDPADASAEKEILSRSVTDIEFARIEGSRNPYGELQIRYDFTYPTLNVRRTMYQRTGATHAP